MFGKTRIRLTTLNAAVFFIIIACLGGIVYTELRHQLYANVDESLRMRIQQIPQIHLSRTLVSMPDEPPMRNEGSLKKMLIQVQGIDPRVFMVLWDADGTPMPLLAGEENLKTLEAFKPYRSIRTPQTVKADGHTYRMIATDIDPAVSANLQVPADFLRIQDKESAFPSMTTQGLTTAQIVSVQAISIIDSEENMLKRLLELMMLGILGGGAVTILAGFYLANKAMKPIRKSWETQQQFVADASHELRMPLSIIRANAELVFRHPHRTILEMSESLSMVLEESKRMGKLTDQLLTLARADSDQEELVLKRVRIEEVIREVVQKFDPIAELKGQSLEMDLDSELEIMGDRERLHQLLVILLDNSMKFTPEHGIIKVSARRGQQVEIVVRDTGPGISPEDLPHIFNRFYRGDKTRSRHGGGTGLGLAIAQWIVKKHGGEITAESMLTQGTTMTIHLPQG
ncbi:sensor histidine kinase [Paenibacillus silviterrae]|uniref:sensor histidine kinase n=1 Tax=Paenibacillus silviterrae TaxID=3242194 RepID=UPI0025428F9F|nr:HAMP domain-containing sensor histidine kinase [Paenibacillus chinjuensis]